MVGTRKSTKNDTNDDNSALLAGMDDRTRERLLKELAIDGEAGLLDKKGKKTTGELGIFSWNGKRFARFENTPQEWIDHDKKKKKQKEGLAEDEVEEISQQQPVEKDEEDAPERPAEDDFKEIPQQQSMKKNEESSSEKSAEDEVQEIQQQQQQPATKKRLAEDDDGEKQQQQPATKKRSAEDVEDEEQQPAKRMRPNPPQMMTLAERVASGTWPTKKKQKKKQKKPAAPAEQEEDDNILPEIVVVTSPAPQPQQQPPPTEPSPPPPPPPPPAEPEPEPESREPSILERLSQQFEARQQIQALQEIHAHRLAVDVAKMSKLNTQFENVSDQIQKSRTPGFEKLRALLSPPWSTESFTPPSSSSPLPETNRGGQRLRWSVNPDRAEHAIVKGRLEGESKSAKRRRVRREIEFVNGLPLARE